MTSGKTPVTILTEHAMKKGESPTFDLVFDGTGNQDPIFKYEVRALEAVAYGSGKTKKEAKHDAALSLLKLLIERGEPISDVTVTGDKDITSPYAEIIKENAIGQLKDYCDLHQISGPKYDLIRDEGLPHSKIFGFRCTVSSLFTEGEARTKKQAKQLAAQRMLQKLNDCVGDVLISVDPLSKLADDKQASSTDAAVKKLMDLGVVRGPQAPLGMEIGDFCSIYRNEFYTSVEQLQELKGLDFGDSNVNFVDILQKVTSALDCGFTFEKVPAQDETECCVVLTINSTPQWVFCGFEPTEEAAQITVAVEALQFLKKMLFG